MEARAKRRALVFSIAMISACIMARLRSPVRRELSIITNRERPNKLAGDGGFWDGGKSFPSGHAMTSWALAAAIANQYPDKKWIRITGYSVAGAISVSRVGGLNHFPSDVLIGSSLGWLIGHYVSHHSVSKNSPRKN